MGYVGLSVRPSLGSQENGADCLTVPHAMLEGISTILVVVPVFLPVMQQLHIDPNLNWSLMRVR
ncbi:MULTISPECIES: hypothetical protein [Xanthobacter]|uniref:hypothetical protein n=1 Tax=Xanthobacter TaxID=279 RepID=UPI0035B2A03F